MIEQGRKPYESDRNLISQAGILKPKLNDLGITLNQSSNWQNIADIPEPWRPYNIK